MFELHQQLSAIAKEMGLAEVDLKGADEERVRRTREPGNILPGRCRREYNSSTSACTVAS